MTLELAIVLGAVVVLLAMSAFFSGSETAMTGASRARIHAMVKDGDARARSVVTLSSKPERMIGAILIGNNLVNILASALATTAFLNLFGQAGVVYATLAMTALVVVFAEVLPKTYAYKNSDQMALRVAGPLGRIVRLLAPVADGVQWIVSNILSRTRDPGETQDPLVSVHEELRGTIDLHHQEGGVLKRDRDMLGGILDLRDLEVLDIMVHRTKMQAIDAGDPPERILDEVLKSPFSRMPIYRDEPENIIGVLLTKDVLRQIAHHGNDVDNFDIAALATDPWFVPDTTGLMDQLNEFLRRKSHFALVVDEYGEVMGLVTLEDIIEEIVGQISDEHDIEEPGIRRQPDGTVNVDGSVPIRDLNRHMDWQLPDEEATTIAGLVIHEAETIPEPGQVFTFYGFRIEILRKQRNQVTALRINPVTTVPDDGSAKTSSGGPGHADVES